VELYVKVLGNQSEDTPTVYVRRFPYISESFKIPGMIFSNVVVREIVRSDIRDGLGVDADDLRKCLVQEVYLQSTYSRSSYAPPPQRARSFQACLLDVVDKFAHHRERPLRSGNFCQAQVIVKAEGGVRHVSNQKRQLHYDSLTRGISLTSLTLRRQSSIPSTFYDSPLLLIRTKPAKYTPWQPHSPVWPPRGFVCDHQHLASRFATPPAHSLPLSHAIMLSQSLLPKRLV